MTTTHPTTACFGFRHSPFVLLNTDTNEQLMPVHNHDPLAPILKFTRQYPHLALQRNPLYDPTIHTCGLLPEDPCITLEGRDPHWL